jgi:hypothetical protein
MAWKGKEARNARQREYRKRPGVAARLAVQRRIYKAKPENKARHDLREKERRKRPEVRANRREYDRQRRRARKRIGETSTSGGIWVCRS